MPICLSKPRQVHAQENEGDASQDPRQEDDRRQEQPLVVFIVVLLAGKQLVRIIDIIEIQVQGRRCRVLEMGSILPLFAVHCVAIDGAPVVAGYLAGGVLVHQRRFDGMAPAFCNVPLPLPADAVGDFFVQRHRDGIAADQDGEYDRPFKPVDGIVGKHRDERLLDTQFQHLPGNAGISLMPILRYSVAFCKLNFIKYFFALKRKKFEYIKFGYNENNIEEDLMFLKPAYIE